MARRERLVLALPILPYGVLVRLIAIMSCVITHRYVDANYLLEVTSVR